MYYTLSPFSESPHFTIPPRAETTGSYNLPMDLIGNDYAINEVIIRLSIEVLDHPQDISAWSTDHYNASRVLFKSLLQTHMKLDPSHAFVNVPLEYTGGRGYSIKHSMNNHPISHNLKKLLKHISLDYLLLCLPTREQADLRTRIIQSGKPHVSDDQARNKYLDLLQNYWYSYNSIGIFLNDVEKWNVLPQAAKNVSIFMQLLAQQYITHDVTPFCIVTFAVAVFLYLPTIEFTLIRNSPADSKLAEVSMKHNLVLKKSLYTHTMCHALRDLQRENPKPFMIGCEGTVDFMLGQLKSALGKSVSGQNLDLEKMMQLYLTAKGAKASLGVTSKPGTLRYELGGSTDNRKNIIIAPCFTSCDQLTLHIQAFVTDCEGKSYSTLVSTKYREGNSIDRVLISKNPTLDDTFVSRPIRQFVTDTEWVTISLCGSGICPKCVYM